MQTPRTIRLASLVFALSVLTMPLSGCDSTPQEAAKPAPVFNPSPDNPKKDITLDNEAEYIKKGEMRQPSKKGR